MNRRANEIEKEYSMNRKQKIKALMQCYGFTRKEADQWLRDGRMKRKKAKVTSPFLRWLSGEERSLFSGLEVSEKPNARGSNIY